MSREKSPQQIIAFPALVYPSIGKVQNLTKEENTRREGAFVRDGRSLGMCRDARKPLCSASLAQPTLDGGASSIVSILVSPQPSSVGWSAGLTSLPNGSSAITSNDLGAASLINQLSSKTSTKEEATKKKASAERLKRSRERNRIHARKTRQRKKEQMQNLQNRADVLKKEQIRLKQVINEKSTANILVGLLATSCGECSISEEDPRVEELLRRPIDEIPDISKIPELPALILPGQHASKKLRTPYQVTGNDPPDDGIDYELLGKDRSKCTPEELDRIRRERNRMHAKRTRDRKRFFMEEMAEMCRKLEEENQLLRSHLAGIDPEHPDAVPLSKAPCEAPNPLESSSSSPNVSLPNKHPSESRQEVVDVIVARHSSSSVPSKAAAAPANDVTFDQLQTLLEAAGSFERTLTTKRPIASVCSPETVTSEGSKSDSESNSEHKDADLHATIAKRRRISAITAAAATILAS